MKLSSQGVIKILPLLIVIAAVGLISFLLVTSTLPLKGIFLTIFPKQPSQAATNQIYWGAFIEGPDTYGINPATGKAWDTVPWDCNGTATCPTWDMFQSHAGKSTSLGNLGFGQCWGSSCATNFNNRLAPMNAMVAKKNVPLLGLGSFGHSNAQIISGMDDAWITTFAQQAKAWGHPFFLRFDWEMNGNWFDWGGATGNPKGNTPQSFIDMWRHVHDIFVAQGANNVTWVWCPNEEAASSIANGGSVSNAANYYPGDAYVDWTCFDVYNWGTIKVPHTAFWRTWEQMAGTPANPLVYQHLLQIAPSKPIMVGESSSSETGAPSGTSKAAWFTDMLAKLPTEYPQIKALSFFFWKINDGGTIADWPIETSTAAQNAFKNGIANSYYATNTFANPPLNSAGKILPPTTLATPTPSPTSTPIPGGNSLTFLPVADTYIASDCPTCNIGSVTSLYTDASVAHTRNSFIRYDLTPTAGRTVLAAVLRIHTTVDSWSGSTGIQNVQYVNNNSWSEQFLNWDNPIDPNSILTTSIGSTSNATQIDTSYDISLNPSNLQAHLGGLYSITMSSPSADNLTFGSRESASPPQLILTFSGTPAPSPTPVPTPTRTPSPIPSPTRTPTPVPTPTRTPSPSPTPGTCPKGPIGDADCDGTIGVFDYSAVITHFGQSGTNILGDVDKDGAVGIFDYSLVVTHFGQ